MVSSLNGKAHIMFYYIIEDEGSSPFSPAYLSIDTLLSPYQQKIYKVQIK